MNVKKKRNLEQKRRWRIRKRVVGTAEKPRLSLRLSNKHIYAQLIDDASSKTLVSVNSTASDLRDGKYKPNKEGATSLGKLLGEKAKTAGVSKVIFDRGTRQYHGCVQAFADAAREAGLEF